CMQAFQTPWTF
nr:immunoglobulin light chain junction region [Macaca mulatta]